MHVQHIRDLHGWASTNYTLTDDPPPVLINPDADALTLLSWGFGQLQQCNALLDVLCGFGSDSPDGDCSRKALQALLHFTVQAESVMQVGMEKLHGQALAERAQGQRPVHHPFAG